MRSASVTHLIVLTRWFPMVSEHEGEVVQRVVASEKDTDTLAKEILASGQLCAVPEVSGPMPDLAPFVALRELTVENLITTSLPDTLGETHPALRELHLREWEGDHARVPASFRGKALESITLPPQGKLDCGLALPALKSLVIPMGELHRWRAELEKLGELEELEVLPDASRIDHLPGEIAFLSKLRKLEANDLRLTSVPVLPESLEWLAASNNRLTSLAPRFGRQDLILFADDNPLAKAEADWVKKEMKKPLAVRTPMPEVERASRAPTHHAQFFHPTWEGVGSMALADDLIVIGRRGGFGVAAFHVASGELVWDRPLDLPDHPRAVTSVGFHGGLVIAAGKDRLCFVDPMTGAISREVKVIDLSHVFVAGDHLFGLGVDPTYWGKGGGMAYRLPDLTPVAGFENIGAVSPDGQLVTVLGEAQRGQAISIVEVATGKVLGTITEHVRHAFRGSSSLFVVDSENIAHEHALDGTQRNAFPLGEDMAALPVNRRARPAVPYVDPDGEYLVIPRLSLRKSVVDNTVAIYDAASGALLSKSAAHAPLRGNLDPRYYGDEYSPIEHPAVVRHGDHLFIGALVRGKDEPLVGTGLTVIPLPKKEP